MSSALVDLRLRFSLCLRVLVALGVLASFSLFVGVILVAAGGLLGFLAWGLLLRAFEVVASAPRLAPHVPVPAAAVALGAMLGLLSVYAGWPVVSRHTGAEFVVPSRHPASIVTLTWSLACLYLLVVEGSAALASLFAWAASSIRGFAVVLLLGAVVTVWGTVAEVRREIRQLRDELVAGSDQASETNPELGSTARRLARQADVPAPEVYVAESDRPESFTVGGGDSAILVVSTALVDALSDEELEAVLAHEVSHLANGDSGVMAAALVPVLVADDWIEDDWSDPRDALWNALFKLAKLYGQFGVAVLSRGREWGADAGAAALCGSPAALASALATLDDARKTPATDLREWEQSAAAIDILPPIEREAGTGPFRTHPSTADRIERLRELAARLEEQ